MFKGAREVGYFFLSQFLGVDALSLFSKFQYHPDTFCRKQVKLVEARCQFATRGCPWTGKLIDCEVSVVIFVTFMG